MLQIIDGLLDYNGFSCCKCGNYDGEPGSYDPEEDINMMFPNKDDRDALYES